MYYVQLRSKGAVIWRRRYIEEALSVFPVVCTLQADGSVLFTESLRSLFALVETSLFETRFFVFEGWSKHLRDNLAPEKIYEYWEVSIQRAFPPEQAEPERRLRRVIDIHTPLDDTKKGSNSIAPHQTQANEIFGAFCRAIELPELSDLEALDLAHRMIDKVCRGQGIIVSLLRENYLDYLESLEALEDDKSIEP